MTIMVECDNCNGAGQTCPTCSESVDNCECTDTGAQWVDCEECNGTGETEDESEEDED